MKGGTISRFCILFVFVAMTILSACRITGLNAEQRLEQLNKMEWLAGNWLWEGGEDRLMEIWTRENDTLYRGRSYFLMQRDTVFAETIRIQPGKRHLYYNVEMMVDGKKKTHSFIITRNTRHSFVAEDKQNLDLSRISYTGKAGVQITICTEGMEDGEKVKEEYRMRRIAKANGR